MRRAGLRHPPDSASAWLPPPIPRPATEPIRSGQNCATAARRQPAMMHRWYSATEFADQLRSGRKHQYRIGIRQRHHRRSHGMRLRLLRRIALESFHGRRHSRPLVEDDMRGNQVAATGWNEHRHATLGSRKMRNRSGRTQVHTLRFSGSERYGLARTMAGGIGDHQGAEQRFLRCVRQNKIVGRRCPRKPPHTLSRLRAPVFLDRLAIEVKADRRFVPPNHTGAKRYFLRSGRRTDKPRNRRSRSDRAGRARRKAALLLSREI